MTSEDLAWEQVDKFRQFIASCLRQQTITHNYRPFRRSQLETPSIQTMDRIVDNLR